MSNDKLSEGVVSIICETNSSIDGHLLPGSTCLAMGGRMFILRKVKTENPVGMYTRKYVELILTA